MDAGRFEVPHQPARSTERISPVINQVAHHSRLSRLNEKCSVPLLDEAELQDQELAGGIMPTVFASLQRLSEWIVWD